MHRLGDRQAVDRQRLALHGHVTACIGARATQERGVDRKRLVEEVLAPVDLHDPDQLLGGALVELPAAVARIDEGVQADVGQRARTSGGDVAVEVADDALRQVVGLDLALEREATDLRHQPPVAADHAPHHALVAKGVEAALLAVALPGRVDQRQVARHAAVEEALLQRQRQRLGDAGADEATHSDGRAIGYQRHRLGGR